MTSLNNNNIREDPIFKTKVKDILLRNSGSGGLVNVLLDFTARDAEAVGQGGSSNGTMGSQRASPSLRTPPPPVDGLTYPQFLSFLADHDVELTPFEQQYLCRAFDETGSGVITAATFTRHLTGLNERRMRAVKKAWSAVEATSGGTVTREGLLSTHNAAQSQRADGAAMRDRGLATAFTDQTRQTFKESFKASTRKKKEDGDDVGSVDDVAYAEFLAFYAGVSADFASDEDFVAFTLKSWAADDATRPTLAETNRTWGADGDPLAQDGPRLVQDALTRELGISSKSYNFSHMQREHPPIEPLPPLSRPEVMLTTTQRTYVPYGKSERTLANPLQTRRGQAM